MEAGAGDAVRWGARASWANPDGIAGRREEDGRTLTAPVRGVFLDALASTCCVRDAAAIAGLNEVSLYAARRRLPKFREEWQAAIAAGYDAVEGRLLRYVLSQQPPESDAEPRGDSPERGDDAGRSGVPTRLRQGVGEIGAGVPAWVQVAIALLNRHRATAEGKAAAVRIKPVTTEQVNAALEKKLDQLARSLKAAP